MVEAVSSTNLLPSSGATDAQEASSQVDQGVPPEYDAVMRATFPMRNTFTFESGVRITSDFEAGNLWKCSEIAPETANDVEPAEDDEDLVDAEEVKTQSQNTAATAEEGVAN